MDVKYVALLGGPVIGSLLHDLTVDFVLQLWMIVADVEKSIYNISNTLASLDRLVSHEHHNT